METREINIRKLCNFYVSDWHLSVMLLPYINNQINEDVKITTIFKNNVASNITTLLKTMNLKNSNKISKLEWKKNIVNNYNKICEVLDKVIIEEQNTTQKITIIANGDIKYFKKANMLIEQYFYNKNIGNVEITIINCYDISQINQNIQKVICNYDGILNTLGERKKEEII